MGEKAYCEYCGMSDDEEFLKWANGRRICWACLDEAKREAPGSHRLPKQVLEEALHGTP